jgi:hypothetical protein
MSIIFRPHRGSLKDAMKEVKEFDNEDEMKRYVVKQWDSYFDITDVVIMDDTHEDNRIGWKDARFVCMKRLGKKDFMDLYGAPQCVGMCATDYKDKRKGE